MGFRDELVGLSSNQTDDDVMYGCIEKDIQIIAAPTETINGNPDVINIVDNANDAELSDIEIIEPTESTARNPEVVIIEDDEELNEFDTTVYAESTPIQVVDDAGVNRAEPSDIQIIAPTETIPGNQEVINIVDNANDAELLSDIEIIEPTESTGRNPEVVIIEDDAELSDIRINVSTSFLCESDVTALPNNRVPTYNCSKCGQKKKGHNCPCKSKEVDGETVDDEFSDPNWIPPNRINTSSIQISPRRSEKRKSSLPPTPTCDGAPSNKTRKISECSYCGAILKGHKTKTKPCPLEVLDNQKRQLHHQTAVVELPKL